MSNITILPGTDETFNEMKGQKFVPHDGEGVVYLKLTFLKPETVEKGDPAKAVAEAPGVVVCGSLEEIQAKINEWFGEARAQYHKALNPEPEQEKY